ncbi:hypothetical protein GCM10027514_09320 [Azotobacter armeniacus]
MDTLGGDRVQGQVAQLAALAVDAQMLEAAAVLEVVDGQAGGFLAAQAVIEQHGEDRPVAAALQGFEQGPGLMIAESRGLAFIRFELGPFDAMHWIAAGDGVALEQVVEQAGEGGKLAAEGGRGEAALLQVLAPGEDMGAGDVAKLHRVPSQLRTHQPPRAARSPVVRRRLVTVSGPQQAGRQDDAAIVAAGLVGEVCGVEALGQAAALEATLA